MNSRPAPEPRWPQIGDYDDHVANLNPKLLLKDSKLWGMQVEMKPGTRSPKVRCGNFGGVYKFSSSSRSVALKLFTGKEPARELRYRLIHDHLRANRDCPYLVGFEYENDGILCNGSRWPALVMDWIDGERLDLHLNRIFQSGSQFPNGAFCQKWIALVRDLDRRGIAHGDLQSGNLLVLRDGGLKLVDYDGMFVPAMNGVLAETPELGLPAYQHPKRVRDFFDQRLDHFSALAILLTFACLNGDLWRRFNGGSDDQCLLFRAADFRAPEQSELMNLLLRSADPVVRKLAVLLRAACQGGLHDVPPFSVVARDSVVAQAMDPSWMPAAAKRSRPTPPPPPPPPPRQCNRCGTQLERSEGNVWNCPVCDRPKPLVDTPLPIKPVSDEGLFRRPDPIPPPIAPLALPQPKKSGRLLGVAALVVIAVVGYAYCSGNPTRRLPASYQPPEDSCTPEPPLGPCDPPRQPVLGLHSAEVCGPDGKWHTPEPRKDWAPDDPNNPCRPAAAADYMVGSWIGSDGGSYFLFKLSSGVSGGYSYANPPLRGTMTLRWNGSQFEGSYTTYDASGAVAARGSMTLNRNGGQLESNWASTDGRRGSVVLTR